MSRLLRINYQGAFHHVIVSGNNKLKIFLRDNDKIYYLLNKYQRVRGHKNIAEIARILNISIPVISIAYKNIENGIGKGVQRF